MDLSKTVMHRMNNHTIPLFMFHELEGTKHGCSQVVYMVDALVFVWKDLAMTPPLEVQSLGLSPQPKLNGQGMHWHKLSESLLQ